MKKLFFISLLLIISSCKKWETYKHTLVHGTVYDRGNKKTIPNALIKLTYYGWSDQKKLFDLTPEMENKLVYNGRTDSNGHYTFEFDAYDPKKDDGLTNYFLEYYPEGLSLITVDSYNNDRVRYDTDMDPHFWLGTAVMKYGETNEIHLEVAYRVNIIMQFSNIPVNPIEADSFKITMENHFGVKDWGDRYSSEGSLVDQNLSPREFVSARTTFHLYKKSNGIITNRDTVIDLEPGDNYVTLPLF